MKNRILLMAAYGIYITCVPFILIQTDTFGEVTFMLFMIIGVASYYKLLGRINQSEVKIKNMETYTREELIQAMIRYNRNIAENPDGFIPVQDDDDTPEGIATRQVDYLISLR